MSDSKLDEIWIEFGGDPSDDKEVYKRYSARTAFKPMSFSDEVIHCVRFSAYEAEKQRADELQAKLEAAERGLSHVTQDRDMFVGRADSLVKQRDEPRKRLAEVRGHADALAEALKKCAGLKGFAVSEVRITSRGDSLEQTRKSVAEVALKAYREWRG